MVLTDNMVLQTLVSFRHRSRCILELLGFLVLVVVLSQHLVALVYPVFLASCQPSHCLSISVEKSGSHCSYQLHTYYTAALM